MYLAALLMFPFIIAFASFLIFRHRVTLGEFSLQIVAVTLIVAMGIAISTYQSVGDEEVWSGKVARKAREQVSCQHSYPCNPYPCGDDKNPQTCWNTCYDHSYDVDWAVYTSENGRLEINRLDRQGLKEPPRWDTVYVGEPTASTHYYQNYIKASPDSVLRMSAAPKPLLDMVPKYPNTARDYYYVDRFVASGFAAPDASVWNYLLARLNADLGASKQVNIVVVAVKSNDPAFEYAMEEGWIGGKKNDLVLIIGTPQYPKIAWARVMSWSAPSLKVTLRDKVQDIGQMDKRDEIIAAMREQIQRSWVRRPIEDFKWLLASHQPGTGATVFLFLLGVVVCCGSSYVAVTNETRD